MSSAAEWNKTTLKPCAGIGSPRNKGTGNGQTNLGWMHKHGRGVEQNDTEAVRWFRLAAEQGHGHGQTNLGWMYERGRGVEQNDTEAVRWFRLAAEQGHGHGQTNLGWLYERGRGVERKQNRSRAVVPALSPTRKRMGTN